jgi:carbon monoxide dehydrogenase subunit G
MLLDPVVLAKVMPNCQELKQTGDGAYEGKMKIQVGPVQGVFQGKVTLSNLQPPTSYHMQVQGKGPAGMVDGEGEVRLEADGEKTVMSYTGEAQVSGRIASIGQRLMDTSARAITKQSLENLEQQIMASMGVQAAPPETVEAVASVSMEQAQTQPASEARSVSSPTAIPNAASYTATNPAPNMSNAPSASTSQYASSLIKELFDEFVPADQQKWVLAGLGLFLFYLYTNWWANLVARRVVRRLRRQSNR